MRSAIKKISQITAQFLFFSVFRKVMERIIYTRIIKFTHKLSVSQDSQFGFRKKRKIIDALACVIAQSL